MRKPPFESEGPISISLLPINSFLPTPNRAPHCRIYYADERTPTGAPIGTSVDGPAAAEEYLKLSERKDQGPWLYSFVKGVGYKDFEAGN